MKRELKMGIVIGAVAIFLGSGFTSPKKNVTTNWYAPLSSTLSTTDPAKNSFSSYNPTPLTEVPSCDEALVVCAAEFIDTESTPAQIIYHN